MMGAYDACGHHRTSRPSRAHLQARVGRDRDPLGRFDSIDGISSLAEGADQIFAEQVLKAGGALTAVVPSAHYTRSFETLADVVAFAGERGVPTTVVWPPGSRRG
jgi:hypothetical protein